MLTRTTTALLEDLVDPANEAVWEAFDDRFRPILVAFGRRLGLGVEDAADAAQDAVAEFVASYRAGRYDRTRGRLSSWLFGIARHCIVDMIARRAKRGEARGGSALIEVPDERTLSVVWEDACEREILRRALARLRDSTQADPTTVRAFELVTFHGRAPDAVAEEVGITVNGVYLAKHRCLKRMRSIIDELRSTYEV